MSQNIIKRGPDHVLLQRIEDLEKTVAQLKANQPSTIIETLLSPFGGGGVFTVLNNQTYGFGFDLFDGDNNKIVFGIPEFNLWQGTVSGDQTANNLYPTGSFWTNAPVYLATFTIEMSLTTQGSDGNNLQGYGIIRNVSGVDINCIIRFSWRGTVT